MTFGGGLGFVVEGIDVRRTAIHEEKNHTLSLGCEISLLLFTLSHHPRQGERGESASNGGDKLTPISLSAKVCHD